MQAVTFQAPGEVQVEERPEPELLERDDAIVRVEATGVCGSDLHIYHGRVQIEPGFTLGHEFVGTVVAAGDGVTQVAEGDRVLGCFCRPAATASSAAGRLPQVRRGPGLRPRQDARVAPGRPGRAGAGAARQPHAAASAGGDVRRRRAVRGRRDGHRLARRRPGEHPPGRHRRGAGARARSASARSRPPRRRARPTWWRSTRSRSGSPGRVLRSRGRPPHRGRPARGGEGGHRRPRRGRRHRRGRPPRRARPGLPSPRKAGTFPRSASMRSASRCTWASSGSRCSR